MAGMVRDKVCRTQSEEVHPTVRGGIGEGLPEEGALADF